MRHDSGVLAAPTVPPRRLPVLGDLPRLRSNLLNAIQYAARDGSELSYFSVGPKRMVFVNRSAAADTVLSDIHTFGKPDGENPLRLVLGDGLISNPYHDQWLQRRRALHPMYGRPSLAGMRQTMADVIAEHTGRWQGRERTELRVHEDMLSFALDIVSRCMFSRSGDSVAAVLTPGTISFLLGFVERRLQMPLSLPVGVPTRRNRTFTATMQGLDDLVHRIIRERRRTGERQGDLLDMLLEARVGDAAEPLTDVEVRDEVLTTFVAAYETTASALTWILYLLACYPDVQQSLREEVRAGTPADSRERPGSTLMEGVINEGMRLFPPSPTIPRQVQKDVRIGSSTVPAGSMVMLNVAAIHRDPDVWERPDEFLPERFRGGTPGKGTFLPFGAGAHMCIGKGFAMMEMSMLLASILDTFEISQRDATGPAPKAMLTLRPREGFGLTLTRM
ncbi:cytochrome P450 [Streptomyces rubellomurinus]|uniref:Cytochrome P450 n=1 Tax=Streptomyces sp. Y1 TaxID=3238634 RepID=A0AB39TTM7_9ACTN|nr:cytochrome P450 [Streptomyces rubellomurinus]